MEMLQVKTVEVKVNGAWDREIRSYLLCGCAVEILNPDAVFGSETMTIRVTGSAQQIRNAETSLRYEAQIW